MTNGEKLEAAIQQRIKEAEHVGATQTVVDLIGALSWLRGFLDYAPGHDYPMEVIAAEMVMGVAEDARHEAFRLMEMWRPRQ